MEGLILGCLIKKEVNKKMMNKVLKLQDEMRRQKEIMEEHKDEEWRLEFTTYDAAEERYRYLRAQVQALLGRS